MKDQEQLKKVREAITTANRSLCSLERAEQCLSGARDWGILDLLGGRMVFGVLKHGRLNAARTELEEARYNLRQLQAELQDVDVPTNIQIDVSTFLTFADYFFDGIVADWLVQSKIMDARNQVSTAKSRVLDILADLKSWESRILAERSW